MTKHPLDTALAHSWRGEFDRAFAILETMPDDPRAQFNMGWHRLRQGDLRGGMELLSVGRWLDVFGGKPLKTDRPIWQDQPLPGARILLNGEGGFGDEIINVRFAHDFARRGAQVTVACSRSLMPLFRTLPYVHSLVQAGHAEVADFDFWVPAMSAAMVLGLEYNDLRGRPYIQKPAPMLPMPDKRPLRIGLRWSGNPQFEDDQRRRFPAGLMLDLAAQRKAEFYSLQRDTDLVPLPDHIRDGAPAMTDWLQTARLIASLDLVITSCTSVAHLAAAMGIETWVVVPICPYYVWALPGDKSPWYDTVRIFRQSAPENWDQPFREIETALTAFLA